MAITVIPPASLEVLYEAMKAALDLFGLGWNQKSKVELRIVGDYLEFKYQMNSYQHYIGSNERPKHTHIRKHISGGRP